MSAKTPVERAQEFAQATIAATPVIILGSGASAAHGVPGMGPLGKELMSITPDPSWGSDALLEWQKFCDHLTSGMDLESALGSVRLSEEQTACVTEATRNFLYPSDITAFEALLSDRRTFPLTRLYRHLFTSTRLTIHVVTPNYDRLAEYAADAGDFSHFTGFGFGHLQSRAKDPTTRVHHGTTIARTVCVWKVHGSLDWFKNAAQQIIGARACHSTPSGYAPLMVTPGIDKFRLTHAEPFRTIVSCADKALEDARSYLCIGYGFNDPHIQEKLIERCDTDSTPVVIVTRDLTPSTKSFLASGRCRKYLAIEFADIGTRMYTPDAPGGFNVDGESLWRLDKFLDFTIGRE